jgi:ADP-ribose pyrophosphatase
MTLVSSERLYTGRVLNLDMDTVRFPDGKTGPLEMIRHPGASAVLPFLDDPQDPDPRIVLIRQFRHATDGFVFEIPAGRLDQGEKPENCAHRELEEETGYTAKRLEHLTTIFTTPGFTDERIHLYLADGLTAGTHRREPDEFMEVKEVRWSEALNMVRTGAIVVGKTLSTILFVQAFVKLDWTYSCLGIALSAL